MFINFGKPKLRNRIRKIILIIRNKLIDDTASNPYHPQVRVYRKNKTKTKND
jgi:hypothetical protein